MSENTKVPTGVPSRFFSGPVLGVYQGQKIFEWVRDDHGVTRRYQGIVQHNSPLNAAPGSVILGPGLLYEP